MNVDAQIQLIEQKVKALISPDPGSFLVEVRLKPTNNIKVFIDGDQGISIERLVQYNRALYKQIEESGMFPSGDFSLEVSSPGLDEPLKLPRQYQKNIGRYVEVVRKDGLKHEGKLLSADENEIVVEEEKGKGKKLERVRQVVPVEEVKMTKVMVRF